ncbi:helix-turn-helix domain-containing protein [Hyphomicrobium sp. CS1BSMeth3]|uniref:helix-turn-helix domain-containing protein n=1 Tax=Hyphomicrobium sp. CS1BSMeth3 TaxID=1892844 RepID=UPI000931A995|nr:helix-turn-helix domain-containing protein [Hyphomicrobium sp. CS1BSMeth3]
MITPAQCRAARGLLAWSQQQLADIARIGIVTVRTFERGETEPRYVTLEAIKRALEGAGVIFVEENGDGAGVRLRKKKPKASSK